MTADVTVIDYGVGNLFSVQRGLERCGVSVSVTSDHDAILAASKVILPGVGAFANAMQELTNLGLVPVIRQLADKGTPLLGICLGMQLLLDESEEFGVTKGLGLIPGRVVPVPGLSLTGDLQKVPHIGWSGLSPANETEWNCGLLTGISPGEAVYFVHSFMAAPADRTHCLADCLYGGRKITAVIGHRNTIGCQFHPEKSGETGLKILRAFCAA